jgi:hypothetical protein
MSAMQATESGGTTKLPAAGTARFLLVSLCWLAGARFASGAFAGGPLWQVMVAVLFISLPLVTFILYQRVISKSLRRMQFLPDSLFYRIFSGRLFGLVLALLAGLPAAVFLLIRLHVYSLAQWLLVFAVVPVFLLVYRRTMVIISSQYRPWLVTIMALRWSRLVTPFLMVLAWLLVTLPGDHALTPALTLVEAIESARLQVADLQGSAALHFAAELVMITDGMKNFALQLPGSFDSRLMLLAAGIEAWLVFWLASTVLSAFMLPWREWRRVLVPLTDAGEPPALTVYDIGFSSAVVSFILAFILLPLGAWLETRATNSQPVQRAPEAFVLQLEQIGDNWYRPGTSLLLEQARQVVLTENGVAMEGMREELDYAFSLVEQNVDLYLDWYYSLGGEYTRIAHLLAGNLEQYMSDRLLRTLQQGDVFAGVQGRLQTALDANEMAAEQFLIEARRILAANSVDPGDYRVEPLLQVELAGILDAPVHQDLISLQSRILAGSSGSAVAGVMTGAVAAKLGSRMVAKGSFKLAAKALGKLVASKTAGTSLGAGAGAAAGAAAGSVVPGIGTAIGAVIGGIAGGLAVGIGIDKALIEFEEAVSRDAFRMELLAAINEVHTEFAVP